jgi:hypothetical protein
MTYPDGVTCEVVSVRLERYLTYSLSIGEALAVAEHLEACLECPQKLVLLRVTMTQTGSAGRRRG